MKPEINEGQNKFISLAFSVCLMIATIYVFGFGSMLILQKLGVSLLVSGLIGTQLAILVFALALYRFKYQSLLKTFKKLSLKNLIHVLIGSTILIVINLSISYIASALNMSTTVQDYSATQSTLLNSSSGVLLLIISSVFIAPIIEESAFRAGLGRSLVDEGGWDNLKYVVISSTLFSLLHWNPGASNMLPILLTFLAGVVLSIFYLKTRNIIVPILIHMIYNSIIIAMMLV